MGIVYTAGMQLLVVVILLATFGTASRQVTLDLEYAEKPSLEEGGALPNRYSSFAAKEGTISEVNNKGFWFSNFTVGSAKNLKLLIDTGSSDVYLNPGEYKPGKKSQNLHKQFHVAFGTTNPDGTGSVSARGPLYKDLVAVPQLSVPNQELGVVKKSSPPRPFPHDGLVGFGGKASSAFGGRPWFHSLCAEKRVPACRFGIAYGTNRKGKQVLGGLDQSMYKGDLIVAPITGEWELRGDVAVGNKVFARSVDIVTDSGTTVVYGPPQTVIAIFQKLGLEYHTFTSGGNLYVRGYFPCNKKPTVGFKFPPTSSTASKKKIFNIVPSAMVFARKGNNCTAALQGTSAFGNIWLVGQAFFQGHYIDHDVDTQTMGFANMA